jgi:uncharacterized protein
MRPSATIRCSAFNGDRLVGSGEVAEVALRVKKIVDRRSDAAILVFDDDTGDQVELDLRGTLADVRKRLAGAIESSAANESPRGPGRPKLGVVAREITLLPRHWEWLNRQPGGASVALRKLVEEARRVNVTKDLVRQVREASYRFMSAMAGNYPGFEEAARALFAGNRERFNDFTGLWPVDVRDHARRLAAPLFEEQPAT